MGEHVSHYEDEGTGRSNNDAEPDFSNLYHDSKNPADFMPAFNTLGNSEAMGKFQGNIYLGRNLSSGNVKSTRFVTFVAENNAALIDGIMAMQTSDAMKSYVNAVSKVRTLEATNVSIKLKRWSR